MSFGIVWKDKIVFFIYPDAIEAVVVLVEPLEISDVLLYASL